MNVVQKYITCILDTFELEEEELQEIYRQYSTVLDDESIDDVDRIRQYIAFLLMDFELDPDELIKIWSPSLHWIIPKVVETEKPKKVIIRPPLTADKKRFTTKQLNNKKKPELVTICNEKGLSSKGTRPELIKRILETDQKVLTLLTADTHHLVMNDFGNYEEETTHFIFDPNSKMVVGIQLPDGAIRELNKDEVETCKLRQYDYQLPLNLE